VRCQLLSVRRAGKGRSKPRYDLPLPSRLRLLRLVLLKRGASE
jgi:hypothetical protein